MPKKTQVVTIKQRRSFFEWMSVFAIVLVIALLLRFDPVQDMVVNAIAPNATPEEKAAKKEEIKKYADVITAFAFAFIAFKLAALTIVAAPVVAVVAAVECLGAIAYGVYKIWKSEPLSLTGPEG